jgi:signal transduction histidine kinase
VPSLFDIAQTVAAEPPTATGDHIYRRFEDEPDTLCIALVDEAGAPVGLIERNTYFLAMASEFGRAIYAKRPISMLMNNEPLIVDGRRPLMEFCAETLRDRPSELLRGFVVVRNRRYVGVGSILSLLQAAAHADRDRATEMSQLAERLDTARIEAQTALEAKARFLTVMSHELRTPLNGVLTVADILAMKMGDSPVKSYVHTIQDSGRQLLRLVNDVLDLSRQGFEDFVLNCTPFSLQALASETADLWSGDAAKKGLGLSARYDGEPGLTVMGDGARLRQVLDNLVSNAIKFTTTGQVEIVVVTREDGADWQAEILVRDTGPGVAADNLEQIFAPFSAQAMDHDQGGAGMGLAIARRIVVRMGGEIRAEASPGGGLSVRVALTLPGAAAKVAPARAA